jgi:hypothetical protein
MTTFYLDTEFNGHGGQLISLALVSPCGEQFYGVCSVPEWCTYNSWVLEHVVPKLGPVPSVPLTEFQAELQRFLIDFDNPEIICDWHKDAVHFLNLLEGPDYSSSLDYACRITVLKTPPGQPVSKNPHNALADATALMEWHQKSDINKLYDPHSSMNGPYDTA